MKKMKGEYGQEEGGETHRVNEKGHHCEQRYSFKPYLAFKHI